MAGDATAEAGRLGCCYVGKGELPAHLHRSSVAEHVGARSSTALLHDVFSSIEAMLPTKDANAYWQVVNRVLLDGGRTSELWRKEKIALLESIEVAREEALKALAEERARIMRLSRQDAIREVLSNRRLDTLTRAVEPVSENSIMDIGEQE